MEMAIAVVGLVKVGVQLSSLLEQFISGCVNAPALVRTVHHEINKLNSILSVLQPLLLGSSPLNQSRASMIYVDQLALIITGCVCTLSELEMEVKVVDRLNSSGKMRVWDRLKWSRMEPAISQLFLRLLSHKSSLTLILTILTSPSFSEARDCSDRLCELPAEHILCPSQLGTPESTPPISRDHTGPGPVVHSLDPTMGNSSSAVDDPESIITITDTQIMKSYRLACESVLFTTRPYRGRSNSSLISLASSQRPKPSWSLISGGSNRSVLLLPVSSYGFSGLNLAEASISDIFSLSLPISADKLHNPRWCSNTPPNLLSRRKSGGSSKLLVPSGPPTLLHHAAKLGQMVFIRQLLEQGADMETKDEDGSTALHVAARNNRVSIVELLLDRGAKMKAKTHGEGTPLHYAALNGHDSTVGLLLDRGAEVEVKDQNRDTPLHLAVWDGHESTVRLLLDRGADVEVKGRDGSTSLHFAALNDHNSTAGLLLDRGADVEAKAQNEETPLHHAALNGHNSTAGLLLDRGANLEVKTYYGGTPLHYASRNGHDSTVVLLLNRGANLEVKAHYGGTPLHYASRNGHDSTVVLLLDRGANMEEKAQDGGTPLHVASWNGHNSIVGLLLDRGADAGARDQDEETLLHNASRGGHGSTVGLLLDRGADVGAKAHGGVTSLHYAVLIF